MSVVTRSLPGCCDLLGLAARDPERYPGLLESVAVGPQLARYDLLFAFPQSALRLDPDRLVDANFLDQLDACWRNERVDRGDCDLPFRGGWLLFLGYELAQQIEPCLRLPAGSASALPSALALRCPAAIIVDHRRDCTWLIAESDHAHLLDALTADLSKPTQSTSALPELERLDEEDPQRYLDSIARVQEYLAAGDVFQVNLSREWRATYREAPSPAALYAALRSANPAPFAGLLQWDGKAVLSSSPERLVEVRGNHIQTRPIAGTRARVAGDDEPARIRELVGHPKERAEHVMLIDLERNDLGRVCVPGSVVVDQLMGIESYAHVHHIVSNVSGRLRAETTPGQVIHAMFPGGTITGCPKVRCMEIIAELENTARGAYTGSLGYLNRDGDMDLNILIRTATVSGNSVRWRAGGGIVADSNPQAELAETRAKARGLLRAFAPTASLVAS